MITNVEKISNNRLVITCTVDDGRVQREVNACKLQKEGISGSSEEFFKNNFESVVSHIIESALKEVVNDRKIKPIGDPIVKVVDQTLHHDKGFTFTAELEVFPDVVLGDYKNIKINKAPVIVAQSEVDKYIQNVLSSRARAELLENEAVEWGDIVLIDFEGFVDGEAFEGGKADKYSLEIGSGQFIPGFEEQIVGMKKGDSRDITVKFPEQYLDSLKGKEAVFKIYLHSVERKVLPELNDDLVKEINYKGASTVQELLEKVREELKQKREKESQEKYLADFVTAIINSVKIDIPEVLITSRIDAQVKSVEEQSKKYGMPIEIMLQYAGVSSMDEYKERIREDVKLALSAELVFEQIAIDEGFSVSDEEIDNFIKEDKNGANHTKDGVKSYLLLQKAREYVAKIAQEKMKSEEKDRTIQMMGEDGKVVDCAVLFTYESEETKKKYVVFFDSVAGNIGAARYADDGRLEEIDSEREWAKLEELLNKYAENM
ncbi:MAG: trigger factor [Clostridia bacterium]|nr:trigger factor [Clostridia bacterium]